MKCFDIGQKNDVPNHSLRNDEFIDVFWYMVGHVEERANFFKVAVSTGTRISLSSEGTSTTGVETGPSPTAQCLTDDWSFRSRHTS